MSIEFEGAPEEISPELQRTLAEQNAEIEASVLRLVAARQAEFAMRGSDAHPSIDENTIGASKLAIQVCLNELLSREFPEQATEQNAIEFRAVPDHIDADICVDVPHLKRTERTPVPNEADASEKKRIKLENKARGAARMKWFRTEFLPSLAQEISSLPFVENVQVSGIFLNVTFEKVSLAKDVFKEIESMGGDFGNTDLLDGERVIVDFSSPNIVKTMHMGHLRSTLIGHVLCMLQESQGGLTYRVNHIGDWGTQFGNLVAAYDRWSDEVAEEFDPESKPILFLAELYRRGSAAVKSEKESDEKPFTDDGRAKFKLLEEGDLTMLAYWDKFKDLSVSREFQKVYKRLGVHFDVMMGESFYEDRMAEPMADLERMGLATREEGGALVVLDQNGKTYIVQKSDGGTVYITRDIAAARTRKELFGANHHMYVIGKEQKHHIGLLGKISAELGDVPAGGVEHVSFGMINDTDGKKISSRDGAGGLNDFIDDLVGVTEKALVERYKDHGVSLDPEEVRSNAEIIAKGNLYISNFTQSLDADMVFDPDVALNTEKSPAIYLQYTVLRVRTLLETMGVSKEEFTWKEGMTDAFSSTAHDLLLQLANFPQVLQHVTSRRSLHTLVRYLQDMAKKVNIMYGTESKVKFVDMPESEKMAYARLFSAVHQVMQRALALLHIEIPTRI